MHLRICVWIFVSWCKWNCTLNLRYGHFEMSLPRNRSGQFFLYLPKAFGQGFGQPLCVSLPIACFRLRAFLDPDSRILAGKHSFPAKHELVFTFCWILVTFRTRRVLRFFVDLFSALNLKIRTQWTRPSCSQEHRSNYWHEWIGKAQIEVKTNVANMRLGLYSVSGSICAEYVLVAGLL